MAKYDITYSCDHVAEMQLYGPNKDRERKIDWYRRSKLCPECQARADADKRAADTEAAVAAAGAAGLPQIEDGSEKQIAWAERIRAGALAAHANQVRVSATLFSGLDKARMQEIITAGQVESVRAAIRDAGDSARRELETQTSARWWIDNRETVESAVYKAMRTAAEREVGL